MRSLHGKKTMPYRFCSVSLASLNVKYFKCDCGFLSFISLSLCLSDFLALFNRRSNKQSRQLLLSFKCCSLWSVVALCPNQITKKPMKNKTEQNLSFSKPELPISTDKKPQYHSQRFTWKRQHLKKNKNWNGREFDLVVCCYDCKVHKQEFLVFFQTLLLSSLS